MLTYTSLSNRIIKKYNHKKMNLLGSVLKSKRAGFPALFDLVNIIDDLNFGLLVRLKALALMGLKFLGLCLIGHRIFLFQILR